MSFTCRHIIGGRGGSDFELYGSPLKFIEVWTSRNCVRAVRAGLAGGKPKLYGTPDDRAKHHSFEFEDGENFKNLTLWGNGFGTHLGGIQFETTKNRTFSAKKAGTVKGQRAWPMDVGSGICIGVEGRSRRHVDCMGFIFINRFGDCKLTKRLVAEIRDNDHKSQVVFEEEHENQGSQPRDVRVKYTKKVSVLNSVATMHKWERSLKIRFNITAGVGLAEASTGIAFAGGYGGSTTCTESGTEEKTITWDSTLNIPPSKKVTAKCILSQTTFRTEFDASLDFTMEDGTRHSLSGIRGSYECKGYSYKTITEEKDLHPTPGAPPPIQKEGTSSRNGPPKVQRPASAPAPEHGSHIALHSTHGTYLGSLGNGTVCLQPWCKDWEKWTVESRGNNLFVLRSHHGTYLRMHRGGGGARVDLADAPDAWEVWRLEDVGGGKMSLRSIAHGTYLCAHPEGRVDGQLAAAKWERFSVELVGNGVRQKSVPAHENGRQISLRSTHRTYLCALDGGSVCLKPWCEEWEKWVVESRGNNQVVLRSCHGTFLRMHSGGSGARVDLADAPDAWEVWVLEDLGLGKMGLRSVAHGTYLCAHPEGKVDGQVTAAKWERFSVELVSHEIPRARVWQTSNRGGRIPVRLPPARRQPLGVP